MTATIHRHFDRVADAESARSTLLAEGFRNGSIKLTVHNAPGGHTVAIDTVQHILDELTPGGASAALQARRRPGALLSVDIDYEDQREQADAIMHRFGAIDA
jgi:hypothetical protein